MTVFLFVYEAHCCRKFNNEDIYGTAFFSVYSDSSPFLLFISLPIVVKNVICIIKMVKYVNPQLKVVI